MAETFQREYTGRMVTLTLAGETLRATARHPFWVVRGDGLDERPVTEELGTDNAPGARPGRWVEAQHLRPGDVLACRRGEVTVEGVSAGEESLTVYNLHVAECRTYAVGECGVVVHNQSPQPSNCDHSEFDPRPLDSQGRATCVVALITRESIGGARADFDESIPKWWDRFRQRNQLSAPDRWEKGHLLGSQLGGPGGNEVRNLVPLHRLANTSAMLTCENRIRDAVNCGHCVLYEARPSYSGTNMFPDTVRITAESDCGFRLDVTIQNVAQPIVPSECRASSQNRVRC